MDNFCHLFSPSIHFSPSSPFASSFGRAGPPVDLVSKAFPPISSSQGQARATGTGATDGSRLGTLADVLEETPVPDILDPLSMQIESAVEAELASSIRSVGLPEGMANAAVLLAQQQQLQHQQQQMMEEDEDADVRDALAQSSDVEYKSIFSKCRMNKHQEIHDLLRRGCNVDIRDEYGNTPLIVAVQNGNKRITKLLLSRSCNIDAQNVGVEWLGEIEGS